MGLMGYLVGGFIVVLFYHRIFMHLNLVIPFWHHVNGHETHSFQQENAFVELKSKYFENIQIWNSLSLFG
jgi:hypothetical protein